MSSLQNHARPAQPRLSSSASDTETLQEIRDAIVELDAKFDEFARVFLNAKFPYGKPTDRWARR